MLYYYEWSVFSTVKTRRTSARYAKMKDVFFSTAKARRVSASYISMKGHLLAPL